MKMLRRSLTACVLVALAIGLSACQSAGVAPPGTGGVAAAPASAKAYAVAGQTVYGLRAAYEAALTAAVAYAKLPRCTATSPVGTCSDQKIVDQLLKARDVARDATGAAESAVRSGQSGNVVQDAANAADAAVKAFVNITNTLKG